MVRTVEMAVLPPAVAPGLGGHGHLGSCIRSLMTGRYLYSQGAPIPQSLSRSLRRILAVFVLFLSQRARVLRKFLLVITAACQNKESGPKGEKIV